MRSLSANLQDVRERMARAAERSGRAAAAVQLVAVTKGHGPDLVRELWQLGQRDFGENRVQEAVPKMELPLAGARWHMLGPLQVNKINKLLPHVALVHSLDSLALARALSERAGRAEKSVGVLVEVKTSSEATKHGVSPEAAFDLYCQVQELPNLWLQGLMTLAPLTADSRAIRESFNGLRRLFESLQGLAVPPRILSMGMSDDFEIAIEEGATLVRIGRALVGGAEDPT